MIWEKKMHIVSNSNVSNNAVDSVDISATASQLKAVLNLIVNVGNDGFNDLDDDTRLNLLWLCHDLAERVDFDFDNFCAERGL